MFNRILLDNYYYQSHRARCTRTACVRWYEIISETAAAAAAAVSSVCRRNVSKWNWFSGDTRCMRLVSRYL